MEENNLEITICHLYPKLLNLYGDIGNIKALKFRAENRGIKVNLKEVNIGEEIPNVDIYFMGGGQDRQQVDVSEELQKHKEFLTHIFDAFEREQIMMVAEKKGEYNHE